MAENLRPHTCREIEEITSTLPLRVRWLCWALKAGSYLTRRNDGTVNRRLESWLLSWRMPFVPASSTPDRGVYTEDVVIDHVNGVWVRLFIPVEEAHENERLPVVVYFHGGGFCVMSAGQKNYDVFCRLLAKRRRVVVVSVEYRLAPEHKFPAAYDDCYAAVAWLKSDESKNRLPRNADLSRCFLMGDSAGGNIVHHVGCRVAERKEDLGGVRVVGHVLIQPYFGGEERTASEINLTNFPIASVEASDWYWKAFLPQGSSRDHPAANVMAARPPHILTVDLPPSLVVVGGADMLFDWQLRYLEYLKSMKKEAQLLFYTNAIHCFHVMPYSLSSQFIKDISNFLDRQ